MRLRKKHFAIPEMKEDSNVIFDGEQYIGKWKELFNNTNEIHLEIGAGKGDFIKQIAKANPNINYIIIEQETNALVYAMRKIKEEELINVRALPIDATKVLNYFSKGELSRIYINFCNPWPKNRHHKRRLTHNLFLKKYKVILKDNSKIYFKTDDLDLFTATLEYIKEEDIKIIESTKDMKLKDYPDNIITEYETKWRSQNIPICYGVFEV